ncbi:MAG: transposase [SAR324 cluster bacterium]|nr:transposase [SAR324 cluster bacterium]MDP7317963.1 transposase [SAR324 cluster bacterium]
MDRPETDSQLFLGLILLKYLTGLSDRELVQLVRENVYQQTFCGFEAFVTDSVLEPSTLTKLRQRLDAGFFKSMEEETHRVLIECKSIRSLRHIHFRKSPEKKHRPNRHHYRRRVHVENPTPRVARRERRQAH